MLKISVVIPSYNQGNFLKETITSILDQNYPSLEVFIIDGGSTDHSPQIIKKYASRINGYVIEKDSGQSEAINKGLKMCSGDVFAWLCSDDFYTPGALNKVNEVFSSLPLSTGLIHGNSEIFLGKKVINFDKGYGNWSIERQLAGMTFPRPSAFMRMDALKRAGSINQKLHFGMDYDLFSRLRMICDFHYEDFYFSKYRLHNASKSTTSIAKFIEEWIVIFNSIVRGMNLENIIREIEDLEIGSKTYPEIQQFFAEHGKDKSLNEDRLMYYFFVNVIRYDYATEKFDRVRKLGGHLKNKYGNYLKLEPSILKIVNRSLMISPTFLKLARKFKRTLTNG